MRWLALLALGIGCTRPACVAQPRPAIPLLESGGGASPPAITLVLAPRPWLELPDGGELGPFDDDATLFAGLPALARERAFETKPAHRGESRVHFRLFAPHHTPMSRARALLEEARRADFNMLGIAVRRGDAYAPGELPVGVALGAHPACVDDQRDRCGRAVLEVRRRALSLSFLDVPSGCPPTAQKPVGTPLPLGQVTLETLVSTWEDAARPLDDCRPLDVVLLVDDTLSLEDLAPIIEAASKLEGARGVSLAPL